MSTGTSFLRSTFYRGSHNRGTWKDEGEHRDANPSHSSVLFFLFIFIFIFGLRDNSYRVNDILRKTNLHQREPIYVLRYEFLICIIIVKIKEVFSRCHLKLKSEARSEKMVPLYYFFGIENN